MFGNTALNPLATRASIAARPVPGVGVRRRCAPRPRGTPAGTATGRGSTPRGAGRAPRARSRRHRRAARPRAGRRPARGQRPRRRVRRSTCAARGVAAPLARISATAGTVAEVFGDLARCLRWRLSRRRARPPGRSARPGPAACPACLGGSPGRTTWDMNRPLSLASHADCPVGFPVAVLPACDHPRIELAPRHGAGDVPRVLTNPCGEVGNRRVLEGVGSEVAGHQAVSVDRQEVLEAVLEDGMTISLPPFATNISSGIQQRIGHHFVVGQDRPSGRRREPPGSNRRCR